MASGYNVVSPPGMNTKSVLHSFRQFLLFYFFTFFHNVSSTRIDARFNRVPQHFF